MTSPTALTSCQAGEPPASKPGSASNWRVARPVTCQTPVASQACSSPLTQRVLVGTQMPPHTPAAHTNGHAAPSCQLPPASHVCGTLFEHWCAPVVQPSVQAPALHSFGQG